ncbi:LPS biosynthesis protein [Flavobacterium noncentrifugens]|uniref:Polysaccharide transporter, PST family n=1 Tax=Flavobacterium noncentrifugens TaxID=1128970 RepID=A0A1G8W0A1_9FLAO|nr:O-antigen translocase [Flavobacterium noncentrifugens]GEP50709.1 LPS biosynthesis protein [Flavobacterium noncentrifugens]SDJ71483.1 polysaccharide transporter, PST family [Flavobacterium noncentrifugens]
MLKTLKQNVLLKVLSMNAVSVAVSFATGIFSTKLISVFLGAPGMAMLGSFKNFSSMLRSVATVGISNSVVKLYVENRDDKKELSVIYSTFFWFFLVISVLLGSITVLFSKTISSFLFFTDAYYYPICFFALFLPLMVLNTFWTAVYNGLEMFKKIIIIQLVSNIAVFAITALLIIKENISGALLSFAFGELGMVVVTFIFIRADGAYFAFDLHKIIQRKYVSVILRFSSMALLSAVIGPMTLILIRKEIVTAFSMQEAGVWDAVTRLSGFYMLLFNSGLSLYYMPKLASLNTDAEFRTELKSYFKLFVPLFLLMLCCIYIGRDIIVKIAFTDAFLKIKDLLFWQLGGDFFRIMTLAFGYQIVIKTMVRKYFFIEILFNVSYFLLALLMIRTMASEGALQAYFFANMFLFVVMAFMFRHTILRRTI